MSTLIQPNWVKPTTILFATELPANEKVFGIALALAKEVGAKLIVFHVYDTLAVAASETSGIRYYDYAAAARIEEEQLRPLAKRSTDAGVCCEIVVRPGLAAPQILAYVQEHPVDRIIMGTRSPGRLGKLFIGSVAEEVVRAAHIPVLAVGPSVVHGGAQEFKMRNIVCAISLQHSSFLAAEFAAGLAALHGANLILQHVVPAGEHSGYDAGRSYEAIEAEMRSMVPEELLKKITVHTISAFGDPAEELLYQSKLRQADLLVLGAQGASLISTLTRQGVVNKVLARALCPVITLTAVSPELAKNTAKVTADAYMAGIF